jgi:hypothetical protein
VDLRRKKKKTKNDTKASGSSMEADIGCASSVEKATRKRKKTNNNPKASCSAMEENIVTHLQPHTVLV